MEQSNAQWMRDWRSERREYQKMREKRWYGSSPSASSTDSELDEEAKAKARKQRIRRTRERQYDQFDHRERSSTDEDPRRGWKDPENLYKKRKLLSKIKREEYQQEEVDKRWAIEHKKKAERANWTIPHKQFKWQLNNFAEKQGLKRGSLHWTIQRKIHNMAEEFIGNLIKESIEVQKSGKHSQDKFVDVDHLNEALRERRRKASGKEEEEYKDVEEPVKSWAQEMKEWNICWE